MMKTLLTLTLIAATSSFGATVTYNGVNANFQGFGVGPAAGTLNGNNITMICVEFDQYVSVGQTWQAMLIPVMPNTNDARAAWLAEQMRTAPVADIGSYQFAIWNIFTPSAPDTTLSNTLLAASIGQNPTGQWVRIQSATVQDFITQTPEPATFALLGVVLITGGFAIRRKENSKKA